MVNGTKSIPKNQQDQKRRSTRDQQSSVILSSAVVQLCRGLNPGWGSRRRPDPAKWHLTWDNIRFSKTLDITGSTLIGLKSEGSRRICALGIGVTLAHFQPTGKEEEVRKKLNISTTTERMLGKSIPIKPREISLHPNAPDLILLYNKNY